MEPAELAYHAHAGTTTVHRYERNEIEHAHEAVVIPMAQALDVPVLWLLDGPSCACA